MRAFVAAIVLAGLVACGSPAQRTTADRGTPSDARRDISAQPEAQRASASAIAAKNRPAPGAPASATGAAKTATPYGARNNMPFVVEMDKTCARPGERMQVVVRTLKGAQVGFAAAYSDNSMVPDIFWVQGDANQTGIVTWTWVIKPTTPQGDAWLDVVAAKKPNKGASYEGKFRVSTSC